MQVFVPFIKMVLLAYVSSVVISQHERQSHYKQAVVRAKATGKRLIVIGDPLKGLSSMIFGPAYGYGDICVDLSQKVQSV